MKEWQCFPTSFKTISFLGTSPHIWRRYVFPSQALNIKSLICILFQIGLFFVHFGKALGSKVWFKKLNFGDQQLNGN